MTEFTEWAREQLHLPDNLIAVNAGSWGPLCQEARKAIQQGYQEEADSRGENPAYMKDKGSGLTRYSEIVNDAKQELGKFLNCSPDEVALCDSSTTAMNIFMWGYNWKSGEEIIAGSLENPAGTIPLMVLAERRDLKLITADLGMGDKDSAQAFSDKITNKTRMILVSDVNFATGSRADLKEITKIAHENDTLVLADGIQAVGTQPVDVTKLGVDGYAMSRHKFLCGPDGGGALYIKKETMNQIHPTYSGVFTDAKHGSAGKLVPMETAQRYEISTRPLPVIQGATAATRWIREKVKLPRIFQHTKKHYKQLWDGLQENKKVMITSPKDGRSLLSFSIQDKEPTQIVNKLKEHNIFTRTIGITKPVTVRISIGFWNRESDIEKIVEVIKTV